MRPCNGFFEYLSDETPPGQAELNLYLPCDTYQTLTDVDTSRDDNIAPQMDGVTEAECGVASTRTCNVAVHKGTVLAQGDRRRCRHRGVSARLQHPYAAGAAQA
jgi:hypothetical protein